MELRSLQASVFWQGKGGMKWNEVLPKVRTLLRIEDPPAYLMIHCCGNDIAGKTNSITLRHDIESDLITLSRMLPNTTLVWSQVLPRLKWRDEDDHRAVNKIRRRINSKIATFVMRMGGRYIRYPELCEQNVGFFDSDKVHLTQSGNDMFLYHIQQAFQLFLTSDKRFSPPLSY